MGFPYRLTIKKNSLNNGPLENRLNGICLWNNGYLFVGMENDFIKLIISQLIKL